MDAAGVSPSRQGWGEPQFVEPAAARHPPRRVRRWWVIGAICAILALGGSYYAVKRTAVNSLSVSCREAHRAKDWGQLERLAARWRRWERREADPLLYLAEAAHETGRPERAAELLDQLPDADPKTPPALVVRSSLLFDELNRPMEGAETLERAIKLDPKLGEARRRLIYYYAFTFQHRKMVDHAYDAIRHDCDFPETYVYLMAQDWLSFANAYDENTKWLRGSPDEELFLVARIIYRIRTKMLDENELIVQQREGISYHRKLTAEYSERFPQNLELLDYHLWRTSKNGDVEEVARFLSLAPPEAADDNRFWRYKGWLHAARGELSEAEHSYRKALLLNCYDFLSQHQLAGVLRRLKRFEEVKAFQELASEGKALQREILQSESVATVSRDIMRRMARYARDCGDDLVAGKLTQRIEQELGTSATPLAPF